MMSDGRSSMSQNLASHTMHISQSGKRNNFLTREKERLVQSNDTTILDDDV